MAEAGFKEFVVEQWQAIYAPAKTPQPIIERLYRALSRILKDPAVLFVPAAIIQSFT